ncbi:STAS/SEC14 domain-containing protein [Akkermansiaceae bacterium]|nr:STAS/SEC14 domain-containing protein [Akkermansiaceae bacterium]
MISLFWEVSSFDGWTTEALFSDIGFDIEHRNDFTRIAMVGEKKW